MKASSPAPRADLPNGLAIGQRFLLSFEDPEVAAPYHGRLQNLSRTGLLCVDAPWDLRPPRGTAVTVSSLTGADDYTFASEIQGRGHLRKSRIPVLLLTPPSSVAPRQRRSSYRISVCLRGSAEWFDLHDAETSISQAVVLTNLSGGGAQVFVRRRPAADSVRLSISLPGKFVAESARRQWTKDDLSWKALSRCPDPLFGAADAIRNRFVGIEAQVACSRVHQEDTRGTIYCLSLAFAEPQEACYQLVRYLERESLRRGVGRRQIDTTAAGDHPPVPDDEPEPNYRVLTAA